MQDTGSKQISPSRGVGRKTTARRTQRKKAKSKITLPIKKIFIWLILLSFLLTTIGFVGYVIFFRTVIAANYEFEIIVPERAVSIAEYRNFNLVIHAKKIA
jgi:hypothetical protein